MRCNTTRRTVFVTSVLLFALSSTAFPARDDARQKENLDDQDITAAVKSELAKETAESVKGVKVVRNEIEVSPFARLDEDIRNEILSALAENPVTEAYEIHVRVRQGFVTLTGQVDSYTEKQVAQEVAEDVDSVVDVINLLRFDRADDRLDADVKADIQYRLREDASIESAWITVTVDDGKVTLVGSVGSALEKSKAETEARLVPGVKSVANNLDVKWWLDGSIGDWNELRSDEQIQDGVNWSLRRNPWVSSSDVTCSVENGFVTLSGVVDNLRAKRAAEQEAEDTIGVLSVDNKILIRLPGTRSDVDIADDVRLALRRDPYVDREAIRVRVVRGRITLTGEVPTTYMKMQAEEAAADVLGAIAIENKLTVDYQFTTKTDKEILRDIKSQLYWSPFVDSNEITVLVKSGVATLIGSVGDLGELNAAKENARQGGATSVVNQLKVKGSGN